MGLSFGSLNNRKFAPSLNFFTKTLGFLSNPLFELGLKIGDIYLHCFIFLHLPAWNLKYF